MSLPLQLIKKFLRSKHCFLPPFLVSSDLLFVSFGMQYKAMGSWCSWPNTPPCHGGDRRFKSGRARQVKCLSVSWGFLLGPDLDGTEHGDADLPVGKDANRRCIHDEHAQKSYFEHARKWFCKNHPVVVLVGSLRACRAGALPEGQ